MGITQGILSASIEAAEKAGATRITEIRVSIGELTEIQEFALQFAFDALTPGTMAEGAVLTVANIPAEAKCNTCGEQYFHDRFQMVCPSCSSFDVMQLHGREMSIDSIEADEPDGEEPCATPGNEE